MKRKNTLPTISLTLYWLLFSAFLFPLFSQTKQAGTNQEPGVVVTINLNDLMASLKAAPTEGTAAAKSKPLNLYLPMQAGAASVVFFHAMTQQNCPRLMSASTPPINSAYFTAILPHFQGG